MNWWIVKKPLMTFYWEFFFVDGKVSKSFLFLLLLTCDLKTGLVRKIYVFRSFLSFLSSCKLSFMFYALPWLLVERIHRDMNVTLNVVVDRKRKFIKLTKMETKRMDDDPDRYRCCILYPHFSILVRGSSWKRVGGNNTLNFYPTTWYARGKSSFSSCCRIDNVAGCWLLCALLLLSKSNQQWEHNREIYLRTTRSMISGSDRRIS